MRTRGPGCGVFGVGIFLFATLAARATDRPDVTIASVTADRVQTTAVPLRLKVTVETKNQGHAYAQHFNCRLFYRLSSSAPWQELDTWHRDGLNQGQAFSHVTQKDFAAGGTYYFKAEADCDKELMESSEGNNVRYASKSFTAGTPDLVVSDLNATTHSVSSSGSWSVKAEWDVENVGDGKATGSFVTVLKVSTNGGSFSEVQRYTTSNLDQGQKRHHTRTSSYSGVQSVRYEVRVDDTHQIQERNEGNNVSYSETLRK